MCCQPLDRSAVYMLQHNQRSYLGIPFYRLIYTVWSDIGHVAAKVEQKDQKETVCLTKGGLMEHIEVFIFKSIFISKIPQ